MRLRVLGILELVGQGGGGLGSPKLRRLLAALLVCRGQVVSVDRLADILWGDTPPANLDGAVHSLVSRLRAALRGVDGSGIAVLTRAPGYLLEAPREAVDATRFEDLVLDARSVLAHRPGQAAALLDEALALWRGPAYAEFADEDFARVEAVRLEELRVAAAEDRVDAALALDRADEAVLRLERLIADHPLRERPHQQLMLACYRLGRQADALRIYREYRDRLDDQLGLEPSAALQQLEAAVLRHDPTLGIGQRTEAAAGNLPAAPAGLVGRDDELQAVVAALTRVRILTLTGPGGVGKTSLALHAAAAAADSGRFSDGVWLVELAAVTDEDAVSVTMTTILGIQQRRELSVTERLVEFLRPKRLLLVLDNCEHVIDTAARLIDDIVRRCPDVVVLATSREPLCVAREHVRPVRPLPVPQAVTLFVERATAAAPAFTLNDGNADAVTELCRRLDGLPLAIELAATRMRSMSPAEAADRLASRFRLLRSTQRVAAERHRTLRAVVDWSYGLLAEPERRVFERLSVFAGSFPLAAAESVAAGGETGDGDDLVDVLAGLVDKSMVSATPGGPDGTSTRYALLETLRAYGREQLAERGDAAAAHRAHATYHAAFVESAAAYLHGPQVVRWADAITLEFDELRAAHAWALDHDLDLAVRLVAGLFEYAELRMAAEVASWAERTVEAVETSGSTHPLVPVAYAVAAGGARFRGDLDRASALAQRGLAGATDKALRLFPLFILSEVALFQGRLHDADCAAQEAEELAAAAGDDLYTTIAGLNRALVRAYSGDTAAASHAAQHLCEVAERGSSPVAVAWSKYVLGEVLAEADPERASELLEEALKRAPAVGDRYLAGVTLVSAASLRSRHGNLTRALSGFRDVIEHWHQAGNWTQQWTTIRNLVGLLTRAGADGHAAVLLGALGNRKTAAPPFGTDAERMDEARQILTERLGTMAFDHATERGAAMSDDEVVAYARAALAS